MNSGLSYALESLRASMTMSPERSTSSKPMTGPTMSRIVSTRSIQSLELLLAVVGLLGPLAGPVLADVGLEVGDLLVLALGLALEHLGLLAAEPPVLGVVARIGRDLAPRAAPRSW